MAYGSLVFFCLRPPRNIAHMFGGWSKLGQQKHNLLLLIGAAALCWVIWLTRNDLVFNKCQPKTFLQVLFRATILALILGSIATAGWTQGAYPRCVQKFRVKSHVYFCFKWLELNLAVAWELVGTCVSFVCSECVISLVWCFSFVRSWSRNIWFHYLKKIKVPIIMCNYILLYIERCLFIMLFLNMFLEKHWTILYMLISTNITLTGEASVQWFWPEANVQNLSIYTYPVNQAEEEFSCMGGTSSERQYRQQITMNLYPIGGFGLLGYIQSINHTLDNNRSLHIDQLHI